MVAHPVVLIEDDSALRGSVVQALQLEGFTVQAFASANAALPTISADMPGVVVSDVRMPGIDGIEFFKLVHEIDPSIPVIFTTAHGDVGMAVEAMKNGAADFFTKPYSISSLVHSIHRAQEKRTLILENRKLKAALDNRAISGWIGSSFVAERLHSAVKEVARTDADVMLTGEPGTGKSYLARLIHENSGRRDRPLVVIDPGIFTNTEAALLIYGRDPRAALSRSGMIERANGGTLVLEGIEHIPTAERARLVSLIDSRSFHALGAEQPRRVDIRIIATSNLIEQAAHHSDALSRKLGGITIGLPTLAERREDIPDFFRHFVSHYERELERHTGDLTEMELRHLLSHDWPGNIRELQMFARNFVLGLTRIAQYSGEEDASPSLRTMMANYEKCVLQDALRRAKGSVPDVQRSLSLPRKTLYDKFAKHGIRPIDYRQ